MYDHIKLQATCNTLLQRHTDLGSFSSLFTSFSSSTIALWFLRATTYVLIPLWADELDTWAKSDQGNFFCVLWLRTPYNSKTRSGLIIISLSIDIKRGGHRATKNFHSKMSVAFQHVNFSAYSVILKFTVLAARIMTLNKNENISNIQRENVHKVNPEVTKLG